MNFCNFFTGNFSMSVIVRFPLILSGVCRKNANSGISCPRLTFSAKYDTLKAVKRGKEQTAMGLNESQKKERSEYLQNNLKITDYSQNGPYVFISYASDDWETVFKKAVVPLQKEHGLRVYADKAFDNINGHWIRQMETNINMADVVIAFVSQSYIESYACFLELMTAINNKSEKEIVFVRLGTDKFDNGAPDPIPVESSIIEAILNLGGGISKEANSSACSNLIWAISLAFTPMINALNNSDTLSKFDVSFALAKKFFPNARINWKTINDIEAMHQSIYGIQNRVFDAAMISGEAPADDAALPSVSENVQNTEQLPKPADILTDAPAENVQSAAPEMQRLEYPSGNIYEGDLQDGKPDGHGIMKYSNGDLYFGQWKDGRQNGHGTMKYFSGRLYDGEWKDGEQHGHGTMKYVNGKFYDGEWKNGSFDGKGIVKYANGSVYNGEWEAGTPCGQGIYEYSGGDLYKGERTDGKASGHGFMRYANGNIYEGEWSEGKLHGQGTMKYADGTVQSGIWNNGSFKG